MNHQEADAGGSMILLSYIYNHLNCSTIDPCVDFLKHQSESLELSFRVYYCFPDIPIVVFTWIGQEPELPTILLSSHMDVVPVFEENWTHNPFGAEMDAEGNIYARGAQDMKCVSIQYIEAVRRLKMEKITLRRTVHLLFTPEEEVGGAKGMRQFSKSQDFRNLRVGFALDEGMASPTDEFMLFNGERCVWQFYIHCPDQSDNDPLLLETTGGEKVRHILNRVYEFRKQQQIMLENNTSLTLGDVTTINLTQLKYCAIEGGTPPVFVIAIDCRIATTLNIQEFETTIHEWCKEAGSDVWIEFEQKESQSPPTKLDDSNPFWLAFKEATDKLNLKVKPQIFPAGTDSRYIRGVGLPAIGFSPMIDTPVLLHANDEYLNKDVFLRGIEIYCKLIPAIGNVKTQGDMVQVKSKKP